MKYVRIIDLPGILQNFEKSLNSYDELMNLVSDSFYGEAGSLEYGLQEYSGFDTEIIVYSLARKFSQVQYLLSYEYLSQFDIILINSFNFLFENHRLLVMLRKKRTVIVWDGIYKNLSEFSSSYDAVLTCSKGIEQLYHNSGIEAYYIPFSYDDRLDDILNVERTMPEYNRAVFVGGINVGRQSHFNRISALNEVRKEVDLYLKLGHKELLKNFYLFIRNPRVGLAYYNLRRKNSQEVHGLEYHRTILKYSAAINYHLDNITTPSNIRLFEVTGLGRALITDRKEGLHRLFKEGEEILAFSSTTELKSHIKRVTNDVEFAKYLGDNARLKTKSSYGIKHRVDSFNSIVNEINK